MAPKLISSLARRLPGLKDLIAHRDALADQRDSLIAEREALVGERDALAAIREGMVRERHLMRRALAGARLEAAAWRPDHKRERARVERAIRPFFEIATDTAGIAPDSHVLEIGCGSGFLAERFADLLVGNGAYVGTDTDAAVIAVCNDAGFPARFTFEALDVRNERHNPYGSLSPKRFKLPFDDGRFDTVVVRAALTRAYPAVTSHLLEEIGRVTRRAGRCVAAAYVLNAETLKRLAAEATVGRSFLHDYGIYRVDDDDAPLKAVALDETWLRRTAGDAGLAVVEPIHYGRWSRPDGRYQLDVVVLEKSAES